MGRYGRHGISARRLTQQKRAGFKPGNQAGSGSVCKEPVPSTVVTRQRAKELLLESEGREYFVCEKNATEKMWNDAICEHSELFPECKKPIFKQKKTDKRLISITACLYCTNCKFTSNTHKLFREQDKPGPGRKPSTLNLATAAALIKSPISGTVFREVSMTMGIDPGSYNGLQQNINKVNDIVVEVGEENRSKYCDILRSAGKPIRASADARYSSPQSSASGPFEGASQSTFNLTEETTGKVIGLHNQNKLCTQATRLRHKGQEVVCPNHEGRCTATLLPSDSIGNEGRSFRKVAADLKNEGIDISHFTSDGDAAMKKALHETFPLAVWLRDSHHFQDAHCNYLRKITFSDTMFKEKTKEWRVHAQKWFSIDLATRCSSEITAAVNKVTEKTKDDSEIQKQINSMLIETPTAIIKCYQNDCSMCARHSLACSGADDGRRWQADNMTESTRRNLKMTRDDETKLHHGILVRLGPDAVEKTFLNTNSQRNEAVNRIASKTIPKTHTFSRNLAGRANAAVTIHNEGPGHTTVLCLDKIGHEISEDVKKKLNEHDKKIQLRAEYRKRPDVKERRVSDRKQKYHLYERSKNKNMVDTETEITYKKRCSIFNTK